MEEDLARFGSVVTSKEQLKMCANAEDVKPLLEQFDAWGKRVDLLHTAEGWKHLKRQAAVERLIQIAYKTSDPQDPEFNPNSRIH
jgi:alkylation response protein AidB-like acyl-CoA dehydrogenase